MQAFSDIFLGWVRYGDGRDFYIRQLHDMKGSIDVAKLRPEGLNAYARICGITLARAHARGGDVVAIASYLGDDDTFAKAVARFGGRYADQAEKDYAAAADRHRRRVGARGVRDLTGSAGLSQLGQTWWAIQDLNL